MILLEEAQARIFALKAPVEIEHLPLAKAVGRWAAEDVLALRTQPMRDLSAMDGYAVRFADSAGPWTIIGESLAGRRFSGSVGPNEGVRIFTGAIIPDGADTVIMQEDVVRDGDALGLTANPPQKSGKHIRTAGGDFVAGSVVVPLGAPLHARHIALVAMAGHASVSARRRIKVAILSTGDELVPLGEPCADDQIPSSNDIMLAAMLDGMPVDLKILPAVADDLQLLTDQLAALRDYDIIVTTGGASVGDHDLIIPALKAAGGEIDFWKIAMRPGKPVIAGRLNDAVVLGLPGNPVSAFVTAFLLLLPLIRHLSGASDPRPKRLTAKLGVALPANGPRLDHQRAALIDGLLMPAGINDSAMLAALSTSNALIIRGIETAEAPKFADAEYYPLAG